MKRWISGEELLELRDWMDFELLNHIKAGLPGYDEVGRRILDVETLPRRKVNTVRDMLEPPHHKSVGRGYSIHEKLNDVSKGLDVDEYVADEVFSELLEYDLVSGTMPIIPPGCKAMSFALPSDKDEALELITKIKSFRFKYQDVVEYERNNGLFVAEYENASVPCVVATTATLSEEPDISISQAKNVVDARRSAQGKTLKTNETGATGETPLNGYKEIAKHLGVTVDTVRKSFKEQKCPIHKYNGRVFAYPTELNKWRNSPHKNGKKK